MVAVAVAGVGMHPFGRFPDASLKDLARVAIVRALDAEPDDILVFETDPAEPGVAHVRLLPRVDSFSLEPH